MTTDFCHMCRSKNLKKYLDLGFQPHSDSFLEESELNQPEIYFPLSVLLCMDCGLSQLSYIVDGSTLYQKNYIYDASITETGKKHYYGLAASACSRFNIPKNSLVVDIGSNVGVLLAGFKIQGMSVLGVDPAPNIAAIANSNGIETIPDFFTSSLAADIVRKKGHASVIAATNIFAHLSDLHDVMRAVNVLLKKEGIFVIEAPYFVDLMNNLEYDTIYHQHLRYLAIKPMVKFFESNGMEIFDVEKYPIHGGSIRVFAARKGERTISDNVRSFIDQEEACQIYSFERMLKFAEEVKEHKTLLYDLLVDLKKKGKRIVCVSAPAKGNTLLNYCNINRELIDYVTEKSRLKQGLFTPGSHIPIYADSRLMDDKPDYALILAWNFAEEIMRNLEEYRKSGGKFIIPIPRPRIGG